MIISYSTDVTSSSQTVTTISELTTKRFLLKVLIIENNYLTTLPDDIGLLTTLNELHVYNNHLTTLPDSIGSLTNLTILNVYNNHLTTLPDSIGSLTNLTILNIRSNRLTTIPLTIPLLPSLRRILFDGIILRSITDWQIVIRLGYYNYLLYTVHRWARYHGP